MLGSAIFFVLAPVTVAGLAPWWICRWNPDTYLLDGLPLQVGGGLLVIVGAAVVLDSFARFAVQGLGTPAPVLPTRHLVVSGLYRYVRNPMYAAVVAAVIGQGLLFGSIRVLEYGAAVWLCCHVFVIAYEEPALARQFGAEYEQYRAAVPRWIPFTRGGTRPARGR